MKKIVISLLVATLTLTGAVPFSSTEKADAASSGWETKNGINAIVYTDRTGDYPASDDWIGVTGEKTSTGGTVYYQMAIEERRSDNYYVVVSTLTGYFAAQSPMKKFYIDNFLSKGSNGTYQATMHLFRDANMTDKIAFWTTPTFKVYN